MPFTPTHTLAILPLARARSLTPAALAIGAMVPDLWAFAPGAPSYAISHSWTLGPLTGLGYGALAFVLFRACRGAAIAFASEQARRRLAPFAAADLPATARGWASVAISLVLGVWTHIFWDSFTHGSAGELFPALLDPWLYALDRPVPGYKVLQLGSSFVGLPILAWWIARWYARLPSDGPALAPASRTLRALGLVLLVSAPLLVLLSVNWQLPFAEPGVLETVTRHVVTDIISLYILGALALSLAARWQRSHLATRA